MISLDPIISLMLSPAIKNVLLGYKAILICTISAFLSNCHREAEGTGFQSVDSIGSSSRRDALPQPRVTISLVVPMQP